MRAKKTFCVYICLNILFSTFIAGCAGKTPNPVQTYQPDDRYLTCSQLREEISRNQAEMSRLFPETQKTGKNVALGVAGAFLIVPWFFMDFTDSERVEIQAYERRDAHLHILADRKKCNKVPPKIKLMKKHAA